MQAWQSDRLINNRLLCIAGLQQAVGFVPESIVQTQTAMFCSSSVFIPLSRLCVKSLFFNFRDASEALLSPRSSSRGRQNVQERGSASNPRCALPDTGGTNALYVDVSAARQAVRCLS